MAGSTSSLPSSLIAKKGPIDSRKVILSSHERPLMPGPLSSYAQCPGCQITMRTELDSL